jgi:hypothetical protein
MMNLGVAIYGLITDGALLSAESPGRETYLETVGAVILGLLLIWLAHAYGDLTSWRARERKPLTLGAFTRTLEDDAGIVVGGALPLLAVLIAWVTGASLSDGVSAGVWTAAGVIVLFEVITGVRSRLSGRALVLQVALGAVLGLLILALRLVLHH